MPKHKLLGSCREAEPPLPCAGLVINAAARNKRTAETLQGSPPAIIWTGTTGESTALAISQVGPDRKLDDFPH